MPKSSTLSQRVIAFGTAQDRFPSTTALGKGRSKTTTKNKQLDRPRHKCRGKDTAVKDTQVAAVTEAVVAPSMHKDKEKVASESSDCQYVGVDEGMKACIELVSYLPVELWCDILSYLSTKSIVTFSCTSTTNRKLVQSMPHLFRLIDMSDMAISDHSMERLIALSQGRCESFLLRNISCLTHRGLANLHSQSSLSEVFVEGCEDITDEEVFVGLLPSSVRKLSVLGSGVATRRMIELIVERREKKFPEIEIEIDIFDCEGCGHGPKDGRIICSDSECQSRFCKGCSSTCDSCNASFCIDCGHFRHCDKCNIACCGNCEETGSIHFNNCCCGCGTVLCQECSVANVPNDY
jgi:hypothetical protein